MILRKTNNKKGFTLIEVVLTIIIISIGLFGMMILFDNLTKGSFEGDLNVISTYLAREKMEKIVFDKVYSGYSHITSANYPSGENVLLGNNNFVRDVAITEVASSDLSTEQNGSGYKRISVTVSWGSAANQRVVLTTLLTNY